MMPDLGLCQQATIDERRTASRYLKSGASGAKYDPLYRVISL
jgi:hypothetical protein